MSSLVPYLTFRDGAASLRFLTDVLGFDVVTEQRTEGGGVTRVWGTRRARLRDLDGHEWSLGSYQPGQSW